MNILLIFKNQNRQVFQHLTVSNNHNKSILL